VIDGKLTVNDRQTKFMLRSLERGSLTLAPIIYQWQPHSWQVPLWLCGYRGGLCFR